MSRDVVDVLFGRALTDRAFRSRLLADARRAVDGYELDEQEIHEAIAWTAATFDQVIGTLEANVAQARFDGVGFDTTASATALDRLIGDVLPALSSPRCDTAAAADACEAQLRAAGIVRRMGESCVQWDGMAVHGCSVLYGGAYADRHYVLPNVCGGRGATPQEARTRAIAEAAERFAGAVCDETSWVFDSHRNLAADAVAPSSFALFSDRQYAEPGFPFARFTEDARVNWTWGEWLLSGKRVLVPAAFVHRPYWPSGHEAWLADLPTTGLACGRSLEEATLNGLYEVIERDAVVITWLNRLAAPRVEVGVATECAGRTLSVHDISTDIAIPVRLAMLVDDATSVVAIGAAARLDPREAAQKAITEALMLEPVVRGTRARRGPSTPGPIGAARSMEDHLLWYSDAERIRGLDFLRRAPMQTSRDTQAGVTERDELATVKRALQQRSLDAIVVDVTLPAIAAAGLRVVRTLVPGLVPLTFGQRVAAKGGTRLYRVPVDLGYRSVPLREEQLNPAPHPFA